MVNRRNITHVGIADEVIRQKNYTEAELRKMGYEYFDRIKEVTMVRELTSSEGTLKIKTNWGDTLVAQPGYMICYMPGQIVHPTRDDYDHWPVEPSIFKQTYKPWDVNDWEPTPSEAHLIKLGCQPYYKAVGVWAKKLDKDAYLQSLEHTEPVKIRTGQYVAIGAQGEPYSMGERTLYSRYQAQTSTLLQAVKRMFGF